MSILWTHYRKLRLYEKNWPASIVRIMVWLWTVPCGCVYPKSPFLSGSVWGVVKPLGGISGTWNFRGIIWALRFLTEWDVSKWPHVPAVAVTGWHEGPHAFPVWLFLKTQVRIHLSLLDLLCSDILSQEVGAGARTCGRSYFGFLLPLQWLDKYLEHCKYPVKLCLVKEADCSYKSWTEKAHCSFPTVYAPPQITFHQNLAMAKMWVASLSLWPYYISCTTSQP